MRGLKSQQSLFTKVNTEQEAATSASFRVALKIAKPGKPFTGGEMIKECVIAATEEMYLEKSLCGKCLDTSEVLKPVISVVNFIKSTGLKTYHIILSYVGLVTEKSFKVLF
ncbi:hypothetical protein Trydic_g21335 [Trypoxylus dichotomus]